jgi:hypothetical protein
MQQNTHMKNFLEITLKLHQIFALLDVDYEKVFPSDPSEREMSIGPHLNEVALALMNRNGFDYTPRERTSEGRVFEHAADSRILIDLLSQIDTPPSTKVITSAFYIKVANEGPADPKNEKEELQVEDVLIQEKNALEAQTLLGID